MIRREGQLWIGLLNGLALALPFGPLASPGWSCISAESGGFSESLPRGGASPSCTTSVSRIIQERVPSRPGRAPLLRLPLAAARGSLGARRSGANTSSSRPAAAGSAPSQTAAKRIR